MVLALLYFDTVDPDGFASALSTTSRLLADVEGFNGLDVRRGVEDEKRFLITAQWDSVDDHLRWQADHAAEFLGVLDPYISGPPDIKHFA